MNWDLEFSMNHEQHKEESRAQRREKKKTPKMAIHGKGMKRFAGTKKK